MRLKKFQGNGINGYLNFDVEFLPELSFLTGINGSGKTSLLNFMISLIMPRFDFLSSAQFEKVSIGFEIDEKYVELYAERIDQDTLLSCTECDETFLIVSHDVDEELSTPRQHEYELDYYRSMISQNIKNDVIKFISNLPTPMYLGLDRRMISFDDMPNRLSRPRYYSRRHLAKKNIFSASLGQSLGEALGFAENKYRDSAIKKARLDEDFRRDIILALLDFPPISLVNFSEKPTRRELKDFEEAKRNLSRLPELLRIPDKVISDKLTPLFDFLDDRAKRLASTKKNKSKERIDLDDPEIEALIDWSYNKTHLKKINSISNMISKYNQKVEEIDNPTNLFLESVNSFITDSGKTIDFNEHGLLSFSLREETEQRELRTLSSGEIQLFVILTHLHFNPEASKAGIFIIDEPELSLHVQWQEKFVDSVMEAANNIQFIMATHSPSIIQEKTKLCIDISR